MAIRRTLPSVMISDFDEPVLWERALRGDGAAFASLFDAHHQRVYRRAIGLLGNAHDADEITAAAFFELWRKRNSVRIIEGSVLPWLLATTVNLSRNSLRSTIRYRALLKSLAPVVEQSEPSSAGEDHLDRISASLRNLSPVDSTLFVLTVLEDVPIEQAAVIVGLKPATARVRLHRARLRLRNELHDLHPSASPATEGQ